MVGEYFGGEHLTAEDVYDPQYFKDYAIEFGNIIRDAWNHTLKRLICMAGLINDPLDETKGKLLDSI